MSAKAIYESDGKTLLSKYLDSSTTYVQNRFITITKESNWDELIEKNPWLKQEVSDLRVFSEYYLFKEEFLEF